MPTHRLILFTVAKRFFVNYKSECCQSPLSEDNFEALLRLCISSDTILINGRGYNQNCGMAMGNNLSPTLSIIYMNEVDELILKKSVGRVLLKRFIDDILAVSKSSHMSESKLIGIFPTV